MTAPLTPEALVERERQELVGLSNHLRVEGHLIDAENIRKALSDNEQLAENCRGNAALAAELRRRLDATEAALQQVTAEKRSACLDALAAQDQAAENDERARTAEAALATATAEAARLRAEVEALKVERDAPVVAEDLGVWTAKAGSRVLYRGYTEAKARAHAAEYSRTALARAATAREG